MFKVRLNASLRGSIYSAIALTLCATVLFLYWRQHVQQIEAFIGTRSVSAAQWVHLVLTPDLHDMGGDAGLRNFGKSLFMHVYRIAWQSFDVEALTMMTPMVVLESAVLILGLWMLVRARDRETDIATILMIIMVIGWSNALYANLARYKHPFFWGLYYNLTDGFRYAALAAVVARRWWWAALAFAVTFMSHPAGALYGLAAGAAMLCVDPAGIPWRRLLAPGLCMVALMAAWIWGTMDGASAGAGQIPVDRWLAFSRMENSHLYPVANGEIFNRTERSVLPILSVLLLYLTATLRTEKPIDDLRWDAALGALLFVSVSGVIFSEMHFPFLIKLQLHRASELLLGLGLLAVTARLMHDLGGNSRVMRILALLLLLGTFATRNDSGISGLWVLLYCMPWIAVDIRHHRGVRVVLAATLWLVVCALCVWVYVRPVPLAWSHWVLTSYDSAMALWVRFHWGWFAGAAALVSFTRSARVPGMVALAIAGALVLITDADVGRFVNDRQTRAALGAQHWARDNTPRDALFMLDPSGSKAWQDVSRRLSFGVARDWHHNAWLYDSNFEIYQEGMKRLGRLGVDPEPYLVMDNTGWKAAAAFSAEIQRAYYGKPVEWFSSMARDYGIDYFVFSVKLINPALKQHFTTAYENDELIILKANDPS